jgi:hypothetical protein
MRHASDYFDFSIDERSELAIILELARKTVYEKHTPDWSAVIPTAATMGL